MVLNKDTLAALRFTAGIVVLAIFSGIIIMFALIPLVKGIAICGELLMRLFDLWCTYWGL